MNEFKDEMRALQDNMLVYIKEVKEEARQRKRDWSRLNKKDGQPCRGRPVLRPVLKRYFDCEVTMEVQRMFRRFREYNYEVDAIDVCDDKVFMVEVNSTPRLQDVQKL